MERLISLFGLVVMMGLAWLLSSHKRRIDLRVVLGGLLLQFALAAIILKTAPGRLVFQKIGDFFTQLLSFVDAGSVFVFGEGFAEHAFAFKVLPTIIFFSAFMSLLYHLGVIQKIVGAFAWLMRWTLHTSGAETLATAANVFVGQTEAPLVIRPYVAGMTQSELMALMVGGFATIAGGVLAAYVNLGIDAGHLITASVISAPAALLIAKIMQPETEQPQTLGHVQVQVPQTSANLVEAVAVGAADGLKLALNVAAMLIAFLGLLAMVDAVLGGAGRHAGYWLGFDNWQDWNWSLTAGLGYAFAPLAWTMGIEAKDCLPAGQLLGERMVSNEFVAYVHMSQWMQAGSQVQLSQRTVVIVTYAMCGFANFGSIGVQLGGIGGIAPGRRADLARLGLRAMLGGTLASFMTACVAGAIMDDADTDRVPDNPAVAAVAAEVQPLRLCEAVTLLSDGLPDIASAGSPQYGFLRDPLCLRGVFQDASYSAGHSPQTPQTPRRLREHGALGGAHRWPGLPAAMRKGVRQQSCQGDFPRRFGAVCVHQQDLLPYFHGEDPEKSAGFSFARLGRWGAAAGGRKGPGGAYLRLQPAGEVVH